MSYSLGCSITVRVVPKSRLPYTHHGNEPLWHCSLVLALISCSVPRWEGVHQHLTHSGGWPYGLRASCGEVESSAISGKGAAVRCQHVGRWERSKECLKCFYHFSLWSFCWGNSQDSLCHAQYVKVCKCMRMNPSPLCGGLCLLFCSITSVRAQWWEPCKRGCGCELGSAGVNPSSNMQQCLWSGAILFTYIQLC